MKADFLGYQLASVNTKLAKFLMVYKFEMAIKALRIAVHVQHPPPIQPPAQHTQHDTSNRLFLGKGMVVMLVDTVAEAVMAGADMEDMVRSHKKESLTKLFS